MNKNLFQNFSIQLSDSEQEIVFKVADAAKFINADAYLIGGYVRDKILGRPVKDIDIMCTGSGTELADAFAKQFSPNLNVNHFKRFGTAQVKTGEWEIEFVGARKESYSTDSRKPAVEAGTFNDDVSRRDFTINTLAVSLRENDFGKLIDVFDGMVDLENKIIRTPLDADITFSDDPLRMMRAARFCSQLEFMVDPTIVTAINKLAPRMEIISAERIHDELVKLIMGIAPRLGLTLLVETGLAEYVLPEIPKLKLEVDEHHHHKDVYEHTLKVLEQAIALEDRLGGPSLVIRLAALLHDIGKPKTRELIPGGGVSFHHHEVVGSKMAKERLKALRFSNEIVSDVSKLVFLHLRFHGYGNGEWTDSAVRRYVRDAGDLLTHLHVLTRADCTTRNSKKAANLAATYDALEARITALKAQEELDAIRPDLDGKAIMDILGIKPSPLVGKAYDYLLELRLEHGPLGEEKAKAELLNWWKENAPKI